MHSEYFGSTLTTLDQLHRRAIVATVPWRLVWKCRSGSAGLEGTRPLKLPNHTARPSVSPQILGNYWHPFTSVKSLVVVHSSLYDNGLGTLPTSVQGSSLSALVHFHQSHMWWFLKKTSLSRVFWRCGIVHLKSFEGWRFVPITSILSTEHFSQQHLPLVKGDVPSQRAVGTVAMSNFAKMLNLPLKVNKIIVIV